MPCSPNCRSNLSGKKAKVNVLYSCESSCEDDGLKESPSPQKFPQSPNCRFWTWLPPFAFRVPFLVSKLRRLCRLRDLPFRIANLRIFRSSCRPSPSPSQCSFQQNSSASKPSSCICGSETCLSRENSSSATLKSSLTSCAVLSKGPMSNTCQQSTCLPVASCDAAAVYHPVSTMTPVFTCSGTSRSPKRDRSPKCDRSPKRGRSPRRRTVGQRVKSRNRERSSSCDKSFNRGRYSYCAESPCCGESTRVGGCSPECGKVPLGREASPECGKVPISKIIVRGKPSENRCCSPITLSFPKPFIPPNIIKLRNTTKLHISCNSPKSSSSRKPRIRTRPNTCPLETTPSMRHSSRLAKSCPSIPRVIKKATCPSKSSKDKPKLKTYDTRSRSRDNFLCSECLKAMQRKDQEKYSGSCEYTSEHAAFSLGNKKRIVDVCSENTPCSDVSCEGRHSEASEKSKIGCKRVTVCREDSYSSDSPTDMRRTCLLHLSAPGRRFAPYSRDYSHKDKNKLSRRDFWNIISPTKMKESFISACTAPCFHDFCQKLSRSDVRNSFSGGGGRQFTKRHTCVKASKTSLRTSCSDNRKNLHVNDGSCDRSLQADIKKSYCSSKQMVSKDSCDCGKSSSLDKKQSKCNFVVEQPIPCNCNDSRGKKSQKRMDKSCSGIRTKRSTNFSKHFCGRPSTTDMKIPFSCMATRKFAFYDEYFGRKSQIDIGKPYTCKRQVHENCGRKTHSSSRQSSFEDRRGEHLPPCSKKSPLRLRSTCSDFKQKKYTNDKSCCTSSHSNTKPYSFGATCGQVLPCFHVSIPTTSQVDLQNTCSGFGHTASTSDNQCVGKSQTLEGVESGQSPCYDTNTCTETSRRTHPKNKFEEYPPSISSPPKRECYNISSAYGPQGKYGLFGKYGPFGIYGLRPCR